MKHLKKLAALGAAAVLASSLTVAASAAGRHGIGWNENMQAAVNAAGQSAELLLSQRKVGQCLGELMNNLGVLEEFKAQKLQLREERLQNCVAEGTLTQEAADEVLEAMKERMDSCDGTGKGQGNGQGLCDGTGKGQGNGLGVCDGTGKGQGNGQGLCDGTGKGQGNGQGLCNGTGRGQGRGNGRFAR